MSITIMTSNMLAEYIQVNLAPYEQKPRPGVQDVDQLLPSGDPEPVSSELTEPRV
jgi:hypothetical protein